MAAGPIDVLAPDDSATALGLVQGHGLVVLVERESFTIDAISTNVEQLLGQTAADLWGRPLGTILDGPSGVALETLRRDPRLAALNPHPLTLRRADGSPLPCECSMHRAAGPLRMIEFEPLGESDTAAATSVAEEAGAAVRISAASDIPALLTVALAEMRRLSGFDRVVIYRSEPHGNWTAIADSAAAERVCYPAGRWTAPTTIGGDSVFDRLPPLRALADVRAFSAPVLARPLHDRAAHVVDLSRAVLWSGPDEERLRAQNPEYRALLRIAIVVRGRLWGCITCTNAQPRRLDYRQRASCELFGHLLAWQLGRHLEAEELPERAQPAAPEAGGNAPAAPADLSADAASGNTAALLRKARAYAQQLRALNAIATTTTSNRKEQIDAALRIGLEQLGMDWAFFASIDNTAREILIENSVSLAAAPVAEVGHRFPMGMTIMGQIAHARGVKIITDVATSGELPARDGWSSSIAVPLFIDGVNYGSIGFTSRAIRLEPFSEADIEFVAMAGELITSAIDRGRQREALVTSETRYRALTEAIPEMLWVIDADNRFEYVNARWTQYTGLTLEQSRTLGASVVDPAGLALLEKRSRHGASTESECEVRLRRHDGTLRWHLMRCVPFHGSNGAWLVTATDIEERKSAEALMTGVHDAALAATEAKSRFLATMSHEIRTPMNAVIGMTELLLLTQLSEEQREYLEIVRNSGQSLLRVLNDILDYSKIEAGKLELESVHFDLPGQIESVVELLRAQYQIKGVTLTTRIKRDVPMLVAGDPGRLRQILLNLVGNALKFTPEGGEVHIDVSALPDADGTTPIPIRFSVEDTGIGIPPEIVDRLFQPFSQGDESTTRKYGGTGLGLSICAQLVALMNGKIGVQSAPGAGSTFWFTIPLRPAKPAHKNNDARKRGTALRSKPVVMRAEKILLVEDNEINTFLALKQLQRIGFIVSAVNNGRQAVEAVERERFDLVFMDCHMPEMDGFAATREIRRLEAGTGRRLPIVAITADARTEDHQNCLRAGMDDYVSKPTSLESLRAVLDRWLPSADRRQNNRNGASRTNPAPTLRVAKLLEIFGGDRGAVITLLTAATGAIKADFARIENCRATGEFASVAEAAHRLKGTSASIRSPRLGEISVAVERAARNANVPEALLDELREAVDILIADVEKHGKLLATIG